MIRTLSEKIVNTIMLEAEIQTNKELYIYGLECLISEFIGNLLLFITAILLGKLLEIVVWTIIFLAIRTQLGGYHCSSHFRCLIFSTILGIMSLVLNYYFIILPNIALIISIVCLPIIAKYAPIIHKNHPLSNKQRKKAKKCVLIFYYIFFSIALLLKLYASHLYAPICSGIITATILACMQLIIEHPTNKKATVR